jgi:hypothetical protein
MATATHPDPVQTSSASQKRRAPKSAAIRGIQRHARGVLRSRARRGSRCPLRDHGRPRDLKRHPPEFLHARYVRDGKTGRPFAREREELLRSGTSSSDGREGAIGPSRPAHASRTRASREGSSSAGFCPAQYSLCLGSRLDDRIWVHHSSFAPACERRAPTSRRLFRCAFARIGSTLAEKVVR